jgi:hypothetical protein
MADKSAKVDKAKLKLSVEALRRQVTTLTAEYKEKLGIKEFLNLSEAPINEVKVRETSEGFTRNVK